MHKYHSEQLAATVFILFFDKIISMAVDFYSFNPYSYPQHQYVIIEVCGVNLLRIIGGLSWQKFDFVFEDVRFFGFDELATLSEQQQWQAVIH